MQPGSLSHHLTPLVCISPPEGQAADTLEVWQRCGSYVQPRGPHCQLVKDVAAADVQAQGQVLTVDEEVLQKGPCCCVHCCSMACTDKHVMVCRLLVRHVGEERVQLSCREIVQHGQAKYMTASIKLG